MRFKSSRRSRSLRKPRSLEPTLINTLMRGLAWGVALGIGHAIGGPMGAVIVAGACVGSSGH